MAIRDCQLLALWSIIVLFMSYESVQGQVTTALKLYSTIGSDLGSDIDILENSTITFQCEVQNIPSSPGLIYAIYLESLRGADSQYNVERYCPVSEGTAKPAQSGSTSTIPATQNAACSLPGTLRVTASITATLPTKWRCRYFNLDNSIVSTPDTIIRSHTQPIIKSFIRTKPTATNDIPKELSEMQYKCQAEARPAPKLRLVKNGVILEGEDLVHEPDASTISTDSTFGITTITWTVNASRGFNGQDLICEVYDHPSSTSGSKTETISVIYGPYAKKDQSLEFNVGDPNAAEIYPVKCGMESNPPSLTYAWFNGTVNTGTKLPSTNDTYALTKSAYSYVTKDSSGVTLTLTCLATNSQNNNKQDKQTITLRIYNAEVTTTTTTLPTTLDDKPFDGFWNGYGMFTPPARMYMSPLAKLTADRDPSTPGSSAGSTDEGRSWTWEIALIVIGAVIFIGLVVLIIYCVVKRRQQSPAQKKKAAAAKNNTLSSNTGSYQNSNVGQPDRISAHPNPNYRLSQANNVEDYADAFDDKPRSRKPIALEDLSSLDPYDAPPSESGPPGYGDTLYSRNDYMGSPQGSYNNTSYRGYGAPC